METTQQSGTENKPVLMAFYSEADKAAWVNGRKLEDLKMWERGCVECNLLPPATEDEFRAAAGSHPELEAWRIKYRRDEFETGLREKLAAKKVPAEVIEQVVADAIAKLGDKVADISIGKADIKIVNLMSGASEGIDDGDDIPPSPLDGLLDMLRSMPGGKTKDEIEALTESLKKLVEMEKSLERRAIMRLLHALDPVGSARFIEVIELRDDALCPCQCDECIAKREAEPDEARH